MPTIPPSPKRFRPSLPKLNAKAIQRRQVASAGELRRAKKEAAIKKARLLKAIVCILLMGVTQTSQASAAPLNKYDKLMFKFLEGKPLPTPAFSLNDAGVSAPLDYTQYGEFQNIGTNQYAYVIKDRAALKKDIGAGIYPNEDGIFNDPDYQELKAQGLLNGAHWQNVNSENKKLAFYIWTHAAEDPGVKTFFTAKILEEAGLILPALKTYYAALVHFPRSAGWAADQSFVWYIAPSAIGSIQRLCNDYPDLECDLVGAAFEITNGQDTDLTNDIIKMNPGQIIHKTLKEKLANLPDLSHLKVVERRGTGKVQLIRYENGHWQMRVDDQPFIVRGVSYLPTEIGLTPEKNPNVLDEWMFLDKNHSGVLDIPYEAWVDTNANGVQDTDEPSVGDFQILKDMGVNALRWHAPNRPVNKYDPSLVNKPLLRDLFNRYGIRTIVYDLVGAYTQGSGASWEKGTDYTNAKQRKHMKEVVRQKVLDLKDEPFVLMWVLGNENTLPADYFGVNATRTNASTHPEAYARFINEVAEMIHKLDPNHPVALGNAGLTLAEYYQKFSPAIDIFGINAYQGEGGFGTIFQDVKRIFDRPVLITEYGCDAYADGKGVDEKAQVQYHLGNLRHIVLNQAGGPFAGNAIGGDIFEYLDEWWKAPGGGAGEQTTQSQGPFAAPDGQTHEEWLGIVGQGSGKNSPFERRLRQAYYLYKDLWNEE